VWSRPLAKPRENAVDDMSRAESTSHALAVVNAFALAEIVSLPEAIDLVSEAMVDLSNDLVTAPERTAVQVAPNGNLVLMPGAMAGISRFGIKALSRFSTAASHGLPGIRLWICRSEAPNPRTPH
jgi:ornithine cyclodeaminase/alanine dehydrogenase-like protein (mu-crystallin family)